MHFASFEVGDVQREHQWLPLDVTYQHHVDAVANSDVVVQAYHQRVQVRRQRHGVDVEVLDRRGSVSVVNVK